MYPNAFLWAFFLSSSAIYFKNKICIYHYSFIYSNYPWFNERIQDIKPRELPQDNVSTRGPAPKLPYTITAHGKWISVIMEKIWRTRNIYICCIKEEKAQKLFSFSILVLTFINLSNIQNSKIK